VKSRLALGTVQFGLCYGVANEGGQVSPAEAARILRVAKQWEIDLLDTAIAYGESEQVLGRIGVSDFNIVSKLPLIPESCPDVESWVTQEVEASLQRLGVPSLYGLLLHRSSYLFERTDNRLIHALEQVKSAGLVRKIGVSIYAPTELDQIQHLERLDLVQAPLNLVDRRLQTSGWLARLKKANIEVHARSVFLQGLLLLPPERIPPKFGRWSELWDRWASELENAQQTAAATCLAYPLSLSEVDRVVVGVDNADQIRTLLAASKAKTSENDWAFMISNDERLINPANWGHL